MSNRRGHEEDSVGSTEEEATVHRDESGFDLASYVASVTHALDDEVQALFERRWESFE